MTHIERDSQEFDYFKFIASVIVIAILLVVISLFIVYPWSFSLLKDEKLSDITMMLLASGTLILTIWEYLNHRKRIKAEVLGLYNERYSKDQHVNIVVPFLIADIMGLKVKKPSVHHVEMFMRFFEEIELQIEKGRLNEKSVYDLFSYYALYFDNRPELINLLCIDDYSKENWGLYMKFVNRMAKIMLSNTSWHCDNDIIEFDDYGYLLLNGKRMEYEYQKGIIRNTQNEEFVEIKYIIENHKCQKDRLEYGDKIYNKA